MDVLDSINYISEKIWSSNIKNKVEIFKHINGVEQALKRNEPKKAEYNKYGLRDICTNCNSNGVWQKNYCFNCGQKLGGVLSE